MPVLFVTVNAVAAVSVRATGCNIAQATRFRQFVVMNHNMFEQLVSSKISVMCFRDYSDVSLFSSWSLKTSTGMCSTNLLSNTHLLECNSKFFVATKYGTLVAHG
jgi:hypothetical protein